MSLNTQLTCRLFDFLAGRDENGSTNCGDDGSVDENERNDDDDNDDDDDDDDDDNDDDNHDDHNDDDDDDNDDAADDNDDDGTDTNCKGKEYARPKRQIKDKS
ncbi:hypothetical protein PoB_006398100 [Plakobranchus ocellatus]|uniref:Uncharacterized protein n=1 Tax=Plakobranchus ocellatus TaxID=259542 RepID=A0AAV4D081_9GAST|nr:hypothetical protein PoB_006398100 [Plakobranchus ocellatus]